MKLPIELSKLPISNHLLPEIDSSLEAYKASLAKVQDANNAAQCMFDSHRMVFPEDFNFDGFLNGQIFYHEAIMARNIAEVKFDSVMLRAYGEMWNKFKNEVKCAL